MPYPTMKLVVGTQEVELSPEEVEVMHGALDALVEDNPYWKAGTSLQGKFLRLLPETL